MAKALSDGGTIVNYGLLSGEQCRIDAQHLIFRKVTLKGFWLIHWFQEAGREKLAAGAYDIVVALYPVQGHTRMKLLAFVEGVNVTFGLRYTHDEKEFSWLNGPREAPELDATVAALEAGGFFADPAWPIPPEAYNFDVVFAFPPINGQTIEGQKVKLQDSLAHIPPRPFPSRPKNPWVTPPPPPGSGTRSGAAREGAVEPRARCAPSAARR